MMDVVANSDDEYCLAQTSRAQEYPIHNPHSVANSIVAKPCNNLLLLRLRALLSTKIYAL